MCFYRYLKYWNLTAKIRPNEEIEKGSVRFRIPLDTLSKIWADKNRRFESARSTKGTQHTNTKQFMKLFSSGSV